MILLLANLVSTQAAVAIINATQIHVHTGSVNIPYNILRSFSFFKITCSQ